MLKCASHSHFSYSYSSARLELSGHMQVSIMILRLLFQTPEPRSPHRDFGILGSWLLSPTWKQTLWYHHCHDLDRSSQPENPNGSLGSETVHPHHRASPNTFLSPHSTPMVSPTISESTPYGARRTLTLLTAKASSTFRKLISFLIEESRWREGYNTMKSVGPDSGRST